MSDSAGPVDDRETLLRTHFSPEHFIDGELAPAAIPALDLTERGFSVDRECLVDHEVIGARIAAQMSNNPSKRIEAYIAPFKCGPVRAEVSPVDSTPAFRVDHDPVDGNPAHAAIYSAEKRSKAHIKALKDVLLPHLNAHLQTLASYNAERR